MWGPARLEITASSLHHQAREGKIRERPQNSRFLIDNSPGQVNPYENFFRSLNSQNLREGKSGGCRYCPLDRELPASEDLLMPRRLHIFARGSGAVRDNGLTIAPPGNDYYEEAPLGRLLYRNFLRAPSTPKNNAGRFSLPNVFRNLSLTPSMIFLWRIRKNLALKRGIFLTGECGLSTLQRIG